MKTFKQLAIVTLLACFALSVGTRAFAEDSSTQGAIDNANCQEDGNVGGSGSPPVGTVERDEFCCTGVGGAWTTTKYPDGLEIYNCDTGPSSDADQTVVEDVQSQPTPTPGRLPLRPVGPLPVLNPGTNPSPSPTLPVSVSVGRQANLNHSPAFSSDSGCGSALMVKLIGGAASSVSASDPDAGQQVTLTASGLPGYLGFVPGATKGTATLTPQPNLDLLLGLFGPGSSATITATDNGTPSKSATCTIPVRPALI